MTNLKRGTECVTTLCIAHRLSTLQHFDRIIVMRDGSIIESGAYE